MGRRIASAFELEVFDQKIGSPKRLEQFLAVYVKHFSPKHRTETNQLIHYMATPLPGRRIIYFGLLFEGEACGFCVLMFYPQHAIGVFDFIVIAPTRRGHGAFFAFAELISEYLERARISFNYLAAEVLLEDGPLTHGIGPKLMIRLLRFQRFRLVKMPYTAPDPSIVDDLKGCRAALMIAAEPDRDSISASELIRVIELIFLDHYLLWFGGVMPSPQVERYEAAVRAECSRLVQIARSRETIVLNGMKDLDIALEHDRSDHQRIAMGLVAAAVAVMGVASVLGDYPVVGLSIVGVALVIFGAALLHRGLRQGLLRLFGR